VYSDSYLQDTHCPTYAQQFWWQRIQCYGSACVEQSAVILNRGH